MLEKQNIIGMQVSSGTYAEQLAEILAQASRQVSDYVCVANVHMLIETHKSADFRAVVNAAFMALPDGKPIALSHAFLHGKAQERVAGMDIFPDLLQALSERNMAAYFYGSTPEVLEKMMVKIKEKYPQLAVAGSFSPPFRTLQDTEKQQVIETVNAAKPHILFVALGCPKQEKWMAEMKGKINCLMIGVGGAFPVFAGTEKRAPKLMQRMALEWFYRLLLDPKRLWKRYLTTNFHFLYLLLKEKISSRKTD